MDASAAVGHGAELALAGWQTHWVVPVLLALLTASSAVAIHWYHAEYLGGLGRVPLLRSLSPRQRRSIARASVRREVPPGGRVFDTAERAGGLLLVKKGAMRVGVGTELETLLGPGGFFGEIAALDGLSGPGSITVVSPVSLLTVPSATLSHLADADPSLAARLAKELRERLVKAGAPAGASAGQANGADIAALCLRLRSVQHVDWGTVTEPWWPRPSGR